MRQFEDLLIDALLDNGFTVEEALRLIALQERIENERRQAWARQLNTWFHDEDLWNPRDCLN